MDTVNEVTAECFSALTRLREAEVVSASPEVVHERLRRLIDDVRQRGRAQRLPDRDVEDVVYALVALTDEIAMSKPEPMRGYWVSNPLQLHYFNEMLAGEGFFDRLRALRQDRRRVDVLRVYYLCLLFGFQGRYAMMKGGDVELIKLIETVRTDVEAGADIPNDLSPAGLPPEEPLARANPRNVLLYIALGVFAVAIAVFVGLRLSLDGMVRDVAERVDQSSE